jgi:hypothetical protein
VEIVGLPGRNRQEVEQAVVAGGRLVFYESCISLVFATLRRPSRVYFLRPGESGLRQAVPFLLLTLALGWWGLPWGVIYTPLVLFTNLAGGCDVTEQVLGELRATDRDKTQSESGFGETP